MKRKFYIILEGEVEDYDEGMDPKLLTDYELEEYLLDSFADEKYVTLSKEEITISPREEEENATSN